MSSAAHHRADVAPLGREVGPMKKSVRFLLISAGAWVAWFLVGFVGGRIAAATQASTALDVLMYIAILLMLVGIATGVIGIVLAARQAWRWSRSDRTDQERPA